MCSLVITIPFYVSAAFAQQGFVNFHAYGKDEIDGFIREQDAITFRTAVVISGDTDITDNQVLMNGAYPFSCSSGIYADCMYREPASGTNSFGTMQPYSVFLYKDDKTRFKIQPITLYRDDKPAIVDNLVVAPPKKTSDGTVTVHYIVKDSASSGCTGIYGLEIYEGNLDNIDSRNPNKVVSINGDPNDCTKTGTFTYTTSRGSGEVTLCALAYDNFGLFDTSKGMCDTFTVDRDGPAVDPDSLRFFDGNKEIYPGDSTFFFSGQKTVTVTVDIIEQDLDLDKVYGDFSLLNKNVGVANQQKNSKANCGNTDTNTFITICTWNNIKVEPDSDGMRNIGITASDKAGNTVTRTISKNFAFDDVGPIVEYIRTQLYDPVADQSYSNQSGMQFITRFSESGSGLNPADIKMNVDGINYESPANNCTRLSQTAWECIWDVGTASQFNGVAKAIITENSKDILGNKVPYFEDSIIFDSSKPIIDSLEIVSNNPLEKVTSGDTLYVIVMGKDANPVYASANLSGYVTGATDAAGSCSHYENGTFECYWSGTINAIGGYNVASKFTFSDIVGNSIVTSRSEPLYERVSAQAPNFYYMDYTYIDEHLADLPISRQVVESNFAGASYYQIVPFRLKFNNSPLVDYDPNLIEVKEIRMDGCEGYASFSKVGNNYEGFLQFALSIYDISAAVDAGQEYLTIGVDSPCDLRFNVIYDKKTFVLPEIEEVRLNIPIEDANVPGITTDTEALEDDIKEIKEWADTDFWETVDVLDNIIQIIKNLCGIRTAFGTLMTIVSLIGNMGGNGCQNSDPATKAIWCSLAVTSSGVMNAGMAAWEDTGWGKYIRVMCDFVNCKGTSTAATDSDHSSDTSLGGAGGEVSGKRASYCDYMKNGLMALSLNTDNFDEKFRTAQFVQSWRSAFGQDTLTLAKKSILFSMSCGCLTGFLYNLRKYRELVCWKGTCYRDFVPIGVPKEECDSQYAYQWCVYLVGELMTLSGLGALNSAIASVTQLLLDPIAAGWSATKYGFNKRCQAKLSATLGMVIDPWISECKPYSAIQLITSIAELVQYAETVETMEWEHETNTCGQFLEGEDDVTSS